MGNTAFVYKFENREQLCCGQCPFAVHMPLPIAFANPTGLGKKLYSIREDDEDGDADDASLAILRSESRANPPTARFASRSLDDDDTARKKVASNNIKDRSSHRTRKDHAGELNASNMDDGDYEKLTNEYEDDFFEDSPRKSDDSANVSSGTLPTEPNIGDAVLKSDQMNDYHASSDNIFPAKQSVVQCVTNDFNLDELRKQQKDIIQRMSSSQEDVLAIRRDLKELHSLLINRSNDDSSKSLQKLLQSLTEEVKMGNVKHGKSISILRVSLDLTYMTATDEFLYLRLNSERVLITSLLVNL